MLRGLGRVYAAPFDVRLPGGQVVQPDVVVILAEHADRITSAGIVGAPDLVVEIASPGTATYDRDTKLHAYERAGVPEYWIADAAAQTIELLVLEGATYRSLGVFRGAATLPSRVLPNFPIAVAAFFA
jgi:Uma2 family endonuclease